LDELTKQQSDLFGNDKPVAYSDDFLGKVRQFERDLLSKHTRISQKKTPRSKIKKDGQGFEYVPVAFMSDQNGGRVGSYGW